MRSERRATRNRVYSLVAGLLVVVLCLLALSTLKGIGLKAIDAGLYVYPDKTLRALAEAQERFRLQDLDGDGQVDYAAALGELEAAGQITQTLAERPVHGYRYAVELEVQGFSITATPDLAVVGSEALFYRIDKNHVVRAAVGGPATQESQVFWHPVYGDLWPPGRPPALGADGANGEDAERKP
jgi:hypothetical protein